MSKTLTKQKHLQSLLNDCPLVVCDLWGVLHDGIKALPPAVSSLIEARNMGVPVALLSNAPKPVSFIKAFIQHIGVSEDAFDLLVTSGSIARDHVRDDFSGKNLFHLGPGIDRSSVDGLPVTLVDQPAKADVILCTGLLAADGPSHQGMLQDAAQQGILMLIANPDRVVHVGDELQLCAGVVGDAYAAMGGPVHWCGKPTKEAFKTCAERMDLPFDTLGGKALMIGDSLKTDIAGAQAVGFKSLLITGGIHREDQLFLDPALPTIEQFAATFGGDAPVPEYWMPQLRW